MINCLYIHIMKHVCSAYYRQAFIWKIKNVGQKLVENNNLLSFLETFRLKRKESQHLLLFLWLINNKNRCTNSAQPNLENLVEIAKCLNVEVSELVRKED